jgi:hypothetical protein
MHRVYDREGRLFRAQILADAFGYFAYDAVANAPIDCIGNLEKRV